MVVCLYLTLYAGDDEGELEVLSVFIFSPVYKTEQFV